MKRLLQNIFQYFWFLWKNINISLQEIFHSQISKTSQIKLCWENWSQIITADYHKILYDFSCNRISQNVVILCNKWTASISPLTRLSQITVCRKRKLRWKIEFVSLGRKFYGSIAIAHYIVQFCSYTCHEVSRKTVLEER